MSQWKREVKLAVKPRFDPPFRLKCLYQVRTIAVPAARWNSLCAVPDMYTVYWCSWYKWLYVHAHALKYINFVSFLWIIRFITISFFFHWAFLKVFADESLIPSWILAYDMQRQQAFLYWNLEQDKCKSSRLYIMKDKVHEDVFRHYI